MRRALWIALLIVCVIGGPVTSSAAVLPGLCDFNVYVNVYPGYQFLYAYCHDGVQAVAVPDITIKYMDPVTFFVWDVTPRIERTASHVIWWIDAWPVPPMPGGWISIIPHGYALGVRTIDFHCASSALPFNCRGHVEALRIEQ